MHQRRRDVSFLNRRMNILGTTAANAINEVRVVVTRGFTVWPGLGLIRQPRLVGVVAVNGKIALRTIKQVTDGVGLGILWTKGLLFVSRLLVGICGNTSGGYGAGAVGAGADFRFVVGDPVAGFEFHHLAFPLRRVETEGGIQRIGGFLVVVEHKVSSHRGGRYREANA